MDSNNLLAIGLTFFSVTAPAAVTVYVMLHKIVAILGVLKDSFEKFGETIEKLGENEEKRYDKLASRIQRLEDRYAGHGQTHGKTESG